MHGAHAGIAMDDKPNLQKWVDKCVARPATSRGLDVPESNPLKSAPDDEAFEKRIAEVQKDVSVALTGSSKNVQRNGVSAAF